MGDHCCNCGEPWDQDCLRHELAGATPEELATEGRQIGKSRLAVLHCPCCAANGSPLPDSEDRGRISKQMADLLGDDEDGLAAELEDLGF